MLQRWAVRLTEVPADATEATLMWDERRGSTPLAVELDVRAGQTVPFEASHQAADRARGRVVVTFRAGDGRVCGTAVCSAARVPGIAERLASRSPAPGTTAERTAPAPNSTKVKESTGALYGAALPTRAVRAQPVAQPMSSAALPVDYVSAAQQANAAGFLARLQHRPRT